VVKITLKSGKDEAIRRFHPWVFSGAIKKMSSVAQEGEIVTVFSNKDEFLGKGHYSGGSIAVRILSFSDIACDYDFWYNRIYKAYTYRKHLGLTDDERINVYRLIHAEGDGLPGLIIDYYNGHAVIQAHSIGMHKHVEMISDILQKLYKDKLKVVYDKSSETLPKSQEVVNKFIYGAPCDCIVNEHGHQFLIDYVGGQKTGFFIDQRENRKILQLYSKGKEVLNTFCYTGGFSIYALGGGARLVHSVDSSRRAIEMLEKNVVLNNITASRHEAFVNDTMTYLKESDIFYDLIILDPPAFAKHRDVKHNAVQGYKRLNAEAINKIRSGGFLFSFSCSQVVDTHLFKSTVISAAIQAGRNVRILHQLSQAPDHPINAFHAEGEYLKGLVLYVE